MVPAPGLLRTSLYSALRAVFAALHVQIRSRRICRTLGFEFPVQQGMKKLKDCSFHWKWCRHQDSNPGPTDYKSVALPAELYRHMVYQGGGILCFAGRQCNVFQLNYRPLPVPVPVPVPVPLPVSVAAGKACPLASSASFLGGLPESPSVDFSAPSSGSFPVS